MGKVVAPVLSPVRSEWVGMVPPTSFGETRFFQTPSLWEVRSEGLDGSSPLRGSDDDSGSSTVRTHPIHPQGARGSGDPVGENVGQLR